MFRFYRIHLKTRDLASSAQWYMEHLGARKVQEYESRGDRHVLLDVDGIEIIVTQPSGALTLPAAPPGVHIGLEHFGLVTHDLVGLLGEMKAKGVEVLEESSADKKDGYAFVRAPDGVRLELVQG